MRQPRAVLELALLRHFLPLCGKDIHADSHTLRIEGIDNVVIED